MKGSTFSEAAALEDGPSRVAALAAWVQSLASSVERKPILVGGAAVELYSGGAYRTGDLDFAGGLERLGEAQLEEVGFRRQGRHWIHEEHQIFLEFPSSGLEEGESAAVIEIGDYSVVVIGLEELIVDRLAAWQFWVSEIDAVNAFRLRTIRDADIDPARLHQLAEVREVLRALRALEEFVTRLESREPSAEDLEQWCQQALERAR